MDLLQRGFVGGSIVTVDPEEARVLGKPWTRRWVMEAGCQGEGGRGWGSGAGLLVGGACCPLVRRQELGGSGVPC